jgi:ubiquinone/menaquinone biosynthesis C-methylase UbiE
MTRKEDSPLLGDEQPSNDWPLRRAKPQYGQNPVVTWLSEFEEKSANEFLRRTGLDYKTTIAQIIEAADPFPGMQVLDVLTGTGVIARQFVGKVGEKGRIIGADTTKEQIELARLAAQSARVSMRIEWKLTPIEKLAFQDNSFDLVTSAMSFHRMDAEKFLTEIYRVLKSGGRMLIADEFISDTGPRGFRDNARRAYLRFIKRDEVEADAQFHTTEQMTELLQMVGFNQIIFRTLRQRNKHNRLFSLLKAVK